MNTAYDFLNNHLKTMAAPYLFIGSGISRRYANLPDWEGLLRHFASFTDHPYEYYRGLASGDLPRTASLLAGQFYHVWWTDDRFSTSRSDHSKYVVNETSALKIEVARYFEQAISNLQPTETYSNEIKLLKKANAEGAITTNF